MAEGDSVLILCVCGDRYLFALKEQSVRATVSKCAALNLDLFEIFGYKTVCFVVRIDLRGCTVLKHALEQCFEVGRGVLVCDFVICILQNAILDHVAVTNTSVLGFGVGADVNVIPHLACRYVSIGKERTFLAVDGCGFVGRREDCVLSAILILFGDGRPNEHGNVCDVDILGGNGIDEVYRFAKGEVCCLDFHYGSGTIGISVSRGNRNNHHNCKCQN